MSEPEEKTMNITTIGREPSAVGSPVWERAGHTVTTLGHEGGNASGADVVLVAVPRVRSPRCFPR